MAYADGTFTSWRLNGPPIKRYPFGNSPIPDKYAVTYEQLGMILPANVSNHTAAYISGSNFLYYSSDFSNANWTKSLVTVSADNQASPLGAIEADVLLETASSGVHEAHQNYTFISGANVFSVFIRAQGRSWAYITADDGTSTKDAFFNISAGSVGTTSNCTTEIEDSLNGWYRCIVKFTAAAGSGYVRIALSTDGSTISYAGNTALGIVVWGADLDVGATARSPYFPTAASQVTLSSSPPLHPSDSLAFLTDESDPQISGGVAGQSRTYARVPKNQIFPGNQWFIRPVMHNIKSGSSYAVSFDEDQRYSWRFDSRKTITRVSSLNALTTTSALPSSNIMFVEGAHTLNLPANSSAATAVSQFNSVLTGLTQVSANVSQGFLSIVWTGTMTSITPPSGVEIVQLGSWIASFSSTGTQTTPATTTFDAASHGGVVGDRCALWAGDTLAGMGKVISVGGTGTFTVMTNDLIAANTLVTHCAFSTDATACYVNGPKLCTMKRTQIYYLPGVSLGIATYADIPDVTIYTDPISWFGRILAVPTGYAAISVADLTAWMGPILMQETAEVQMSDAIDTVTP